MKALRGTGTATRGKGKTYPFSRAATSLPGFAGLGAVAGGAVAGPVGAVRVGYIDGEFVFNPTIPQMEESVLNLRLAGTADALLMVEAGAKEVSEELIVEAIRRGHEAMQPMIATQNEMRAAIEKLESRVPLGSTDMGAALAEAAAQYSDQPSTLPSGSPNR